VDIKTLKILYQYGINLGISFQIIDDILDFTQNKLHLGKPNGADLINGNITLPVIFALKDKNISKILDLNSFWDDKIHALSNKELKLSKLEQSLTLLSEDLNLTSISIKKNYR